MTTRLCWMMIDPLTQGAYKRIVDGIRLDQFTSNLSSGFLVDSLRADYLEARFVQKVEFTETLRDPFGNEQNTNRVDYTQLRFRLQNKPPHLELANPPRQLSPFLSRLGEFTQSESAIYSPVVPVSSWLSELSSQALSLLVTGALVTDVEVGDSIIAKVALTGEQDVRGFIPSLTGRRKYTLAQIAMSLRLKEGEAKLVIKPDARYTITPYTGDICDAIREHMSLELGKR